MLTDKTLTIEISGVMGAGFLPGLLQSIQANLRSRFVRLQPNGQRRPLVVRFHIDNTVALKEDPVARERVAQLINRRPRPDDTEWTELVEALKQADHLFERNVDGFRLPVDVALRRGGLIHSYVLLNSNEWAKIALDRPRAPNLVVYLTADLPTTEESFEHDAEIKATFANDPQAYCATPQRAIELQQLWAVAMKRVPGVITIRRTTQDKHVLAGEIIDALLSPLRVFGLIVLERTKVFISYTSADEAFAARLEADLKMAGIPCWFAPHDVEGGKTLYEQIEHAIRLYDRLLLIVSEDSMASEWVKTEIAYARERELVEDRRVLFPIRLVPFEKIRAWKCFDADAGKDSAREIREFFIPDFSDWKDQDSYQRAFQRLLRDL